MRLKLLCGIVVKPTTPFMVSPAISGGGDISSYQTRTLGNPTEVNITAALIVKVNTHSCQW